MARPTTQVGTGVIGPDGRVEKKTGGRTPGLDFLASAPGRDFIAAMRRRMGETPEQRLKWVIDFAHRDLDQLRPEERTALGYDLLLIAVNSRSRSGVKTWLSPEAHPPLMGSLHRYQQAVADGLRGLLSHDQTPMKLPGTPQLERWSGGLRINLDGDEAAGVLGGIAQLVVDAGERLMACKECGRAYVKVKRKEYCTIECSQRARNRRKAEKKREAAKRAVTVPKNVPGSTSDRAKTTPRQLTRKRKTPR